MIDPELYKVWVDVSWPNSFYDGKWEEGEILRFISITSDAARGWIGSKESYLFNETGGGTTLLVELHCTPEWVPMFEEGYPPALAKLKEICYA